MTRNLAFKRHRGEKRRIERERAAALPEMVHSTQEVVEREEVRRQVVESILGLREPYRSAILFRYYQDLSPREMAERLDLPLATVRSRIQRGLAVLRDRLDARHGGDRKMWLTTLLPAAGLPAGTASAGTAAGSVGTFAGVAAMSLKIKVVLAAVLVLGTSFSLWHFIGKEVDRGSAKVQPGGELDGKGATGGSLAAFHAAETDLSEEEAGRRPPEREPIEGTRAAGPWITVSGRVVNMAYPGIAETDSPATGLEVEGGWDERNFLVSPKDRTSAITDERGNFFLSIRDPGTRPIYVSLKAPADARHRRIDEIEPVPEGSRSLEGLVLRRAAHGILEGETVDDQGVPLDSVRIVFPEAGPDKGDLEVRSDHQGRFRVSTAGLRAMTPTRADREGYTFFEASPLLPEEKGGWKPLRIVMVPSGRLQVRVLDGKGQGIPDRKVDVALSKSEPRSYRTMPWSFGPSRFEEVTDATGTARFDRVWSGKRLRATVGSSHTTRSAEQMKAGRLVYEGVDIPADPLMVPRSGQLEVTVLEEATLTLRGTVFFPDRRPVMEPKLVVRNPDEPSWNRHRMTLEAFGDEEGRYEVKVPEAQGSVRLQVMAFDEKGAFLSLGSTRDSGRHAASVVVKTGDAVEGVLEQDLVLEPVLSISGHVLTKGGEPVRSRVRAVPAGSAFIRTETALGRIAEDGTDKEGFFCVTGLPPGRFDLYASQEIDSFYSFAAAYHCFTGIEAGAEGLKLVLEDKRTVKVRIHAEAVDGEVTSLSVLHGRFLPRDDWDAPSAIPPRTMTVRRLTDWPLQAPLSFLGISGREDEEGEYELGFYATRDTKDHALPLLEPGWYVIGVQGSDPAGNPYFPVATPRVYLEAGLYDITFRLVPTSTVEGRVHFQGSPGDLRVALRETTGGFLPLRLPGIVDKAYAALPVGGDGRFRLHQVPLGSFVLCFGSEKDLKSGEASIEREIIIKAGENPVLEIQAP